MRFPILGKSLALAGVMLGLLWSLSTVRDLVAEREGRLREAQRSIADSLAGSQTLAGPVLQRRCVEQWKVEHKRALAQGDSQQAQAIWQREMELLRKQQELKVGLARP